MKYKKTLVVISLVLLVSILLLVFLDKISLPFKKEGIHLDSLDVKFNTLTQNNITAVTTFNRTKGFGGYDNVLFMEYFQNDLNIITQNNQYVENITIRYWFRAMDWSSAKIEFTTKLKDKKKKEILDEIKSQLITRWYVQDVQYSLTARLAE